MENGPEDPDPECRRSPGQNTVLPLSDQLLSAVRLRRGQSHRTRDGAVASPRGDESTAFFIRISESLKVCAAEITLGKVQAVAVVGEMGFTTGIIRSATLEVEAPARLIVVGKAEFESLLASEDQMAARIYRRLADKLRWRLRAGNV